jgi:hypothetical protein
MKKLFFSAVALVAFSSVSMGNTIAVEESSYNNKEKEEKVLLFNSKCMQYAADKAEAAEAQYGCMTSAQYNNYFWGQYNKCLDKSISAN